MGLTINGADSGEVNGIPFHYEERGPKKALYVTIAPTGAVSNEQLSAARALVYKILHPVNISVKGISRWEG